MRRKGFFVMVCVIFSVLALLISWGLFHEGAIYKRSMLRYAEVLNFEERLLQAGEWIWGDWQWQERWSKAEVHKIDAEASFTRSLSLAIYMILLVGIFLGSIVIISVNTGKMLIRLTIGILLVCIFFLFIGISVPMLEISAFSLNLEIPIKTTIPLVNYPIDLTKTFDGRMYYYYQNKSVLDLIGILFGDGNFVVALAILTFSILMPLTKLILSYIVLISGKGHELKYLRKTIKMVAKWSMADVFVASIFLAFLSFYNMNTGIDTESVTLPGAYFFLSYVILSIISGILLERVLSEKFIERTLELEIQS